MLSVVKGIEAVVSVTTGFRRPRPRIAAVERVARSHQVVDRAGIEERPRRVGERGGKGEALSRNRSLKRKRGPTKRPLLFRTSAVSAEFDLDDFHLAYLFCPRK
jgi:hypothetical protein